MRAIITPLKMISLKQRALRKRIWFRVLDGTERAIVNLTIQVVKEVRSDILSNILVSISEKLNEVLLSPVVKFTETVGRPLARKIASAVGRTDYVRVALEGGRVLPVSTSGASILSSTVRAAGCVIVPRGLEGMPEGAEVEVLLYDEEPAP